jgi:hypothetical protein
MTIKKKVLGALIAMALTAFAVSTAHATTVYNYTGKVLKYGTMPYSASNRITGSVTLAEPLGNNVSASVAPIAFTFTDGKQTISNTTPDKSLLFIKFHFTTDATGQIIDWVVNVEIDNLQSSPGDSISSCGKFPGPEGCEANDTANYNSATSSGYNDTPGIWTKVPQ